MSFLSHFLLLVYKSSTNDIIQHSERVTQCLSGNAMLCHRACDSTISSVRVSWEKNTINFKDWGIALFIFLTFSLSITKISETSKRLKLLKTSGHRCIRLQSRLTELVRNTDNKLTENKSFFVILEMVGLIKKC